MKLGMLKGATVPLSATVAFRESRVEGSETRAYLAILEDVEETSENNSGRSYNDVSVRSGSWKLRAQCMYRMDVSATYMYVLYCWYCTRYIPREVHIYESCAWDLPTVSVPSLPVLWGERASKHWALTKTKGRVPIYYIMYVPA